MTRARKSCLVVDDSKVVRRIARRILEANGFDVAEASDGRFGLQACREALPDCLLLDWNMPHMNGFELLVAVRREFGPDRPPVVFCTTENDMTAIERALLGGAQEYIMKPFDEAILMGKLAQIGLA